MPHIFVGADEMDMKRLRALGGLEGGCGWQRELPTGLEKGGVSIAEDGGEGRGKDSQALHSALDWRDKWGKTFPCTRPTRVQPSARHCVIPKFGREGPPQHP